METGKETEKETKKLEKKLERKHETWNLQSLYFRRRQENFWNF